MPTSPGSDHAKALALLCLLYICGVLLAQLSYVMDPSFLHEQHRILFNYYRDVDSALFAGDYLASVLEAAPRPYLYEGITRLWLWAGGDLIVLNRLVPAACWLGFLAGLALVARTIGDRVTIFGTLALAVAQPIYLHQIAGSTPHAFAFPLLVWGLVALLHASTRGLVLATLLSGLIYEAMAPLLGLMLAWHLIIASNFFTRPRADQLRSLVVLTAIGASSLWLVLKSTMSPESLGTPLEPMQHLDLYPENGPGGPYNASVFKPPIFVLAKALEQFRTENIGVALAILTACVIVALYGLFTLPRGSARQALVGFALCAITTGLLIYLMKPFHSYRFLFYPFFTVFPLFVVGGLQVLWRRVERLKRFANALTVAFLVPLVVSFDSLDTKKFGYWVELAPKDEDILAFAAAQPPDMVFAIWPNGRVALDFIPYIAQRPLFIMIKMHFPTHDKHVLRMRQRTYALIDAYLSTEEAQLRPLHCRWGVDYLVVDKSHFQGDGQRPDYFTPFDARIAEIWDSHRPEDFYLHHPEPDVVALDTVDYAVIDLGALAGESGCATAPEAGKAD